MTRAGSDHPASGSARTPEPYGEGPPVGGSAATAAPPAPAPAPAQRGELGDPVLGKAYDLKLIRRLWPFVRPHWRLLVMTALIMPFSIALELAQP